MPRRVAILLVLALILLGAAYVHGSFDRPLSSIGLNFHRCARNGVGETFCGSELERYEERWRGVQERLKALRGE